MGNKVEEDGPHFLQAFDQVVCDVTLCLCEVGRDRFVALAISEMQRPVPAGAGRDGAVGPRGVVDVIWKLQHQPAGHEVVPGDDTLAFRWVVVETTDQRALRTEDPSTLLLDDLVGDQPAVVVESVQDRPGGEAFIEQIVNVRILHFRKQFKLLNRRLRVISVEPENLSREGMCPVSCS